MVSFIPNIGIFSSNNYWMHLGCKWHLSNQLLGVYFVCFPDHICGQIWQKHKKTSLYSFKAVPIESIKYAPLHYNYHILMTVFLADIQETWKPIWPSSFMTLS